MQFLRKLSFGGDYGVVSHVAGGGSQVDDGRRRGAAVSEGVHVSHHIVPEFTLFLRRHAEIDVLRVALHLRNLLVGDGQSQSLRRRATEAREMKIGFNGSGILNSFVSLSWFCVSCGIKSNLRLPSICRRHCSLNGMGPS